MAEDSQRYNRRAVRQLLLAAFSAEELRDLFYFSKTPELQAVPDQFAPGDSYPTMVRKAVRYCDSRFLLGEMLAEVKEANPRAYARYEKMLRAPSGAVPSRSRPRWFVPALAAALAVIIIAAGAVIVLPRLADGDGDGLSNAKEARLGTDPAQADTDGDGLSDGDEVKWGANPKVKDTDGDTLLDGTEVHDLDTSPTNSDTDGDGVPDATDPDPRHPPVATPTGTPGPVVTPTHTSTATPSPTSTPTPTALPSSGRQFIVIYSGEEGVSLHSEPGSSFEVRARLEEGTLLEFRAGPVTDGEMRWWSVYTLEGEGWVAEWEGGNRLIKPFFQVGDSIMLADPTGRDSVTLWSDDCGYAEVLPAGTELWVKDGPRPTLCRDVLEAGGYAVVAGTQWWEVDTSTGSGVGWVADLSTWRSVDAVWAMAVAPRWYVELTAP